MKFTLKHTQTLVSSNTPTYIYRHIKTFLHTHTHTHMHTLRYI